MKVREEAQADTALLARLNGAADRLATATIEIAMHIEGQRLYDEQQMQARQDALFAKFSTVDISDKYPDENVCSASITVSGLASIRLSA